MTAHTKPPEVESAPTARASEAGDGVRGPATSASGSTSDSRLGDLLHRLADADAISASRVRAWDRLQERRSA